MQRRRRNAEDKEKHLERIKSLRKKMNERTMWNPSSIYKDRRKRKKWND